MPLTNPSGDAQVTNPQAMRALAHPTRLAILSYLQRNGPATATTLSPHVGATPSVTSWHLRHLASHGLVVDADPGEVPGDRRQRWWKAIAGDFAESQLLGQQMSVAAQRQVDRWIAEVGPVLEPEWLRLSGISNTSVPMTRAELEALTQHIDQLIAPFVRRAQADAPPEARIVRILRHFLPEAPS